MAQNQQRQTKEADIVEYKDTDNEKFEEDGRSVCFKSRIICKYSDPFRK